MVLSLRRNQETGRGQHVFKLLAKPIPPCGILSGREGSCIVLSMRQLGDAVIGSGFINSLRRSNPKMTIDVLGLPRLEEAVRCFGAVRDFIHVNFPVYGHHRRDISALKETFHAIRMVRARKYDYCINLIGDLRENAIGILTGAKWNIAPVWERGHLFKRKMTDTGAALLTNCGIIIPAAYPGFYESMRYLANELGLAGLEWPRAPRREEQSKDGITIAIHPGASHPSRHWPVDRWQAVIRELRLRGDKVKILGARFERAGLLSAFSKEATDRGVEVVTEEVPSFISCLAAADALIGMDSFSVHAAYALGVPVVVLNGSADPSILTPPGGAVTSAGHLCKHFPCYYSYPCIGAKDEYICVRGIEVSAVMEALDAVVERARLRHLVQDGVNGHAGSQDLRI